MARLTLFFRQMLVPAAFQTEPLRIGFILQDSDCGGLRPGTKDRNLYFS